MTPRRRTSTPTARSRARRRRPLSTLLTVLAVLALVGVLLAGWSAAREGGGLPGAEGTTAGTPAADGTAASALAALPIKGRAPKTGYSRDQFGPAWSDVDGNGCDTRDDVLARDLEETTFRSGTRRCVVASGVLHDPYTGRNVRFTRGQGTSDDVQIDHVVALSDAWQKGAQQLSEQRRRELANDPLNLLAVDGPTNTQKSDADAASWLPPASAYRCDYVARQIAVKTKYALWVTPAEHDAMATVLSACPDEPLPAGASMSAPRGLIDG